MQQRSKNLENKPSSFLQGIKKFQKISGDRFTNSFLIYTGDEEVKIQGVQLINFRNSYQIVQ